MSATITQPFSIFRSVKREGEPATHRSLGSNQAAHGYQILTTDLVVFRAVEKTAGHSCLGGVRLDGDAILNCSVISSRPLPETIDVLPFGTPERNDACAGFFDALKAESHAVIIEAFPHAAVEIGAGNARWVGYDLHCSTMVAKRIVQTSGLWASRIAAPAR